ncbi:MAG: VOC family protein [Bacteroidota bacterium]
MKSLNPYLMFPGHCEEALQFYVQAFDGEIEMLSRFGDGPMEIPEVYHQKVMHATLRLGEVVLQACDHLEGMGQTPYQQGSHVQLSATFQTLEKLEAAWAQLTEGGKVSMELQDTFWGSRFGMVQDRYGTAWMMSCDLPKA